MGNAVRFRKPTRRKSPFKTFCITLLVIAILAVAGYFAYGYIMEKFFPAPAEPEKPEIIYIIEEKDPPPPPPVVEELEIAEETETIAEDPIAEEIPVVPEATEPTQTEEPINEVDN